MKGCSVSKDLKIVRGSLDDYKQLEHYHYRARGLGPFVAIFALKAARGQLVGIIVYSMPTTGSELRALATGNCFGRFDRATQLGLINTNIRRISRVILEPRFRGLGLAARLVRETMPKMKVAMVEAMAVMGRVNPFFEKAGMSRIAAKMPGRCVQLSEAMNMVGIEDDELIDARKLQRKIEGMDKERRDFIEFQIEHFLESYGRKKYRLEGIERIRFVLGKLCYRPMYYMWFNPEVQIVGS